MLVVSYESQKANVQSNQVVLSAIPLIGSLAAALLGRTEVQAEQQSVRFIFNADTKVLMEVNSGKQEGQARDRTGIELLQDASVSLGKPQEAQASTATPSPRAASAPGSSPAQAAVAPQGAAPAASAASALADGDVISAKIQGVRVLDKSQAGSKQAFALKKDEQVVYLGQEKDGLIKIQGASGEGWVDKRMMKK